MLRGARDGAWAKSGAPLPYGGLCFTANVADSSVALSKVGSPPDVTLVKSFDGKNWSEYLVGETIVLPNPGDRVFLAAGESGNNAFATINSNYHKFVMTGSVAASGDISSLRSFGLSHDALATYCYARMFNGCTGLTSAPELPATTLGSDCYQYMFVGCTGLTSAPELPATTLVAYCYQRMFSGCTGLTSAPKLPATTLTGGNVYNGMFYGCTGLTSAPELPATTLSLGCYRSMFSGCTGLTSAPELPATTLSLGCYNGMFDGCTGLTSAPELPATTLMTSCYQSMFKGCTALTSIRVNFTAWGAQTNGWVSDVSPTGTFYKPIALVDERGTGRIPAGWDVVNVG